MWLFTQHGFYSVTRSRTEPDKFQIRGRVKKDLQNIVAMMRKAHPECADWKSAKVIETTDSDYRYRIIVPVVRLHEVMDAVVDEIGYSNFKSHIASIKDQKTKLDALHRIWSIMFALQPRRPLPPMEPGDLDDFFGVLSRAEDESGEYRMPEKRALPARDFDQLKRDVENPGKASEDMKRRAAKHGRVK